jgi:hypothetical protein
MIVQQHPRQPVPPPTDPPVRLFEERAAIINTTATFPALKPSG